jgi:hypothetical protein
MDTRKDVVKIYMQFGMRPPKRSASPGLGKTTNWTTTATFYIACNLSFANHPPLNAIQSELRNNSVLK